MTLRKLNSMQTTFNKSLHHMLQRRCWLHYQNLSIVCQNAVAAVLDKLNVKKAPGVDRIAGRVLRESPHSGILWLTRIFNAILQLGTFPSAWKSANIIMLPKAGKSVNLS